VTAFLDDRLARVLSADSEAALRDALVGFTAHLGFDSVSAMLAIDRHGSRTDCHGVEHMPEAYRQLHADPSDGRRDPVMQHCRTSHLPIAWDRNTYLAAGQGEKWERQAGHGLASGLAVALHLPRGRHFLLGIDRREGLPDRTDLFEALGRLQLFAVYAHEAMTHLVDGTSSRPSLTRREIEALEWASIGKTAWETSRLLGISERTVVKHLVAASGKLGCAGKQHAVAAALRLGLIR
jgi:DNA-binding CsgD family transcriptional regulator